MVMHAKFILLLASAALITKTNADCPPDATMDLVFLVDTSSSIRKAGQEAIDSIRSFIYAVIDGFTIGPNHTQFGAISYNRDPKVVFELDEFIDSMTTKAAVDLMDFTEGRGTETGKAMHYMADMIEKGFGKRSDSKVVAMVITDGRSSEKKGIVYEAAERLKDVVDIVIAVGVNMKKENELSKEIKDIASDPDEHYAIEADSYDSLSKIKDIVKQCICMGISKQHCFMPPMMSADDPSSFGRALNRPRPRPPVNRGGGSGAIALPPVAGPNMNAISVPSRIESDACCGQITFNTGMQKCCAFGKNDQDKFLVEVEMTCPVDSEAVSWDYNFSMDYSMDMDMMHGMDHGMDMNHGMDMMPGLA